MNSSMSRKGYMAAPLVFIALALLAVAISSNMQQVDRDMGSNTRSSMAIDGDHFDLLDKKIDQINFAKIATYRCSISFCFNASLPNTGLENCINSSLSNTYGPGNWTVDVFALSGKNYLKIKTQEFDIGNGTAVPEMRNELLSNYFLKTCG